MSYICACPDWGCSWCRVGGAEECCSTPPSAQDTSTESDLAQMSAVLRERLAVKTKESELLDGLLTQMRKWSLRFPA